MMIETIILIIVAVIFIIYFIMSVMVIGPICDAQEEIIKYDKEMEERTAVIEEKLKVLAENSGVEFQDNHSCWWVKIPILEEKVNDLESFLQSNLCQTEDKEDIQ